MVKLPSRGACVYSNGERRQRDVRDTLSSTRNKTMGVDKNSRCDNTRISYARRRDGVTYDAQSIEAVYRVKSQSRGAEGGRRNREKEFADRVNTRNRIRKIISMWNNNIIIKMRRVRTTTKYIFVVRVVQLQRLSQCKVCKNIIIVARTWLRWGEGCEGISRVFLRCLTGMRERRSTVSGQRVSRN